MEEEVEEAKKYRKINKQLTDKDGIGLSLSFSSDAARDLESGITVSTSIVWQTV